MAPTRKKARTAASEAVVSNDHKSNTTNEDDLLTQHDHVINQFIKDLTAIQKESSSDSKTKLSQMTTKASSTLLELRSFQRDILQIMQDKEAAVQAKRQDVERQAMALKNLTYERKYLEQQVQLCRDYQTPQLERMCRSEMEEDDEKETSPPSSEDMMNQFLCGSTDKSHGDPQHQKQIMSKLHKELNLRGNLERDLAQAKSKLKQKQQQVEKKKLFLQDIPKKLRDVEVASLPLQRFFHKSSMSSDISTSSSSSSTVRFGGTERKELLDKARTTLPGPLYVLFVQLHYYVDAFPQEDLELEVATIRAGDVTTANKPEKHCVIFRLCPPLEEKNTKKQKKVSIQFLYYATLQVITCRTVGSATALFPHLLESIFAGDTGNHPLNGSNVMTQHPQQSDKDDESSSFTNLLGCPYHWCNFMGGLNFPEIPTESTPSPSSSPQLSLASSSSPPLEKSTKAIVKTIQKRIRAQATLKQILKMLEGTRKPDPIPLHPAMMENKDSSDNGDDHDTMDECTAKLVSWSEKSKSTIGGGNKHHPTTTTRSFVATIKRGSSSTLRASVTIDMTTYPLEPPVWSLNGTEQNWGDKHGSISTLVVDNANGGGGTTTPPQPPLFSGPLSQLEDIVNHQVQNLVLPHNEETYEWILAHQLRKLIESWDSMQRVLEEGGSHPEGPDRKIPFE